jgi:UDP:flavonoid glycosyltransferase YjiC (YdhE family)
LQAARWLTGVWAREWHDLRREFGFPAVAGHPLWEGQHAPRRSLGLFPRVLGEPQLDWPDQARVTGFPFYRAPDRALDPALRQFLMDGDPPLVFTLGTTAVNEPGGFFGESLAAARNLGLRAVLLVGADAPAALQDVSGDAIAVAYAPHGLLFPHALAIVHQGGIGTLAEAMRAGKPMLIMPYAHDQADNAWRAGRLGVARVLPRRRYTAAVVERELARLVRDSGVAAAAASVSRRMAHERGVETAADLILDALQ